jgi:hypothetical protein
LITRRFGVLASGLLYQPVLVDTTTHGTVDMKKLMGLVAAVGTLCLAPAIASASTINFGFETNGTLSKTDCGISLPCYEIQTTGTATETTGTSSWTLSGQMTFYGDVLPWNSEVTGAGPGSWSFMDVAGGNNLTGSVVWALANGTGNAFYDITGGTGLFAGALGDGISIISISKWYSELPVFSEVQGQMHVITPSTKVPEPSPTGLVAVGLAMMGFAVYRRRRANVTRS